MNEFTLSEQELETLDLWETVDKIKEKILWETENENKDIQAMMLSFEVLSFEVNQVINELLQLSISFTREIVTHK